MHIFLYLLLLSTLLGWLLALYFKWVFNSSAPKKLENFFYPYIGINQQDTSTWDKYTTHLLLFSFIAGLLSYLIFRYQSIFPWNDQNLADIPAHLAFSWTLSLLTNTDFQSFSPETTLSAFSQMTAVVFQQFVSPAIGICVALCLIRSLQGTHQKIGNFHVDLIRTIVFILLPLSILFCLILNQQGTIQHLSGPTKIQTLEGFSQYLPQGLVSSQTAIKMLGTNGAGYFNTGSAHPYENPTAFSNFIQMLAMILIPTALIFYFGFCIENKLHAFNLWCLLWILVAITTFVSYLLSTNHIPSSYIPLQWAGKDSRFGLFGSSLFLNLSTNTGCGATNSTITNFYPLSILVFLWNLGIGCIGFGGCGSGFFNLLTFVLLSVFITGLLIGKTPSYCGKKIQKSEIKMLIYTILPIPLASLLVTTFCLGLHLPFFSVNFGAQKITEILMTFLSSITNNGIGVASLQFHPWVEFFILPLCFLLGRYFTIIPIMCLSGILIKKEKNMTDETFTLSGIIFITFLLMVIFLIGGLSFLPAFSIGPYLEHLRL